MPSSLCCSRTRTTTARPRVTIAHSAWRCIRPSRWLCMLLPNRCCSSRPWTLSLRMRRESSGGDLRWPAAPLLLTRTALSSCRRQEASSQSKNPVLPVIPCPRHATRSSAQCSLSSTGVTPYYAQAYLHSTLLVLFFSDFAGDRRDGAGHIRQHLRYGNGLDRRRDRKRSSERPEPYPRTHADDADRCQRAVSLQQPPLQSLPRISCREGLSARGTGRRHPLGSQHDGGFQTCRG